MSSNKDFIHLIRSIVGEKPTKGHLRKVTEVDRKILDLKVNLDNIRKLKKNITYEIDKNTSSVISLLKTGDKIAALIKLKRKKNLQEHLNKLTVMEEDTNQLIDSIEMSQIQLHVLDVLKEGSEALKILNNQMSDVKLVLENVWEEIKKQKDIEDLMLGDSAVEDQEAEDELNLLLLNNLPVVRTETPKTPVLIKTATPLFVKN